ncbi:MAG: type IV toxin-antitoxin system AbiEi family antitoxin [Mycobacteriales bacterium]
MTHTSSASRARHASGLPGALARTSFAVVRPSDAREVYAHPSPEFRRLTERGLLHRLATGYYAVVPPGADGLHWLPGLESAAYGIGAADYGSDAVVLIGLSAARLHGAVPRALAVAVVAVPKQRPILSLADREARVIFVRRDTDRLDAERVRTDLGTALVTGAEQTVLDLAHRPELGGVPREARAAAVALWPRCDNRTLDRLAQDQRLRAARDRAESWAGRADA